MNEIAPAASGHLGMCGDSDEGLGTIRGEGWTTDSDVGRGVGVGLSVTAKCARNANAEPISRLECGQEACRGRGWRRVLARGMEVRLADEVREGERKIREGGEVLGFEQRVARTIRILGENGGQDSAVLGLEREHGNAPGAEGGEKQYGEK